MVASVWVHLLNVVETDEIWWHVVHLDTGGVDESAEILVDELLQCVQVLGQWTQYTVVIDMGEQGTISFTFSLALKPNFVR